MTAIATATRSHSRSSSQTASARRSFSCRDSWTEARRQQAEIEHSLARIGTELGARPTTFAYPVGYRETFDASTKAAAATAGVRRAFSNYGGYTRPSNWDPLDIRRVGVGQSTSEAA